MIISFANDAAESAWARQFRKGVPNDIMKVAHRKLTQINSAVTLDDLRVPPGNRLEALARDRAGQYSILSTISGGSALSGVMEMPLTLNS